MPFFVTLLLMLCGLCSPVDAASVDAVAQPMRAAVVYDRPNKFDHSFNQSVYEEGVVLLRGAGIAVKEFEPVNNAQTEQSIMKLARRGYQPIIGVGYATAPAIKKAALRYPNVSFMIVDSVIALPNVQSIVFDEGHGAYLAGALAAMTSKTNKIGFIGGMDIPLISKFSCGYRLGARSIKPDIGYVENFVGSTLSAWNDPSKGLELAIFQFESGADVIFSAAGGTGLGVFQAANEYGKLAIGVDSNQNHLQPGAVLSSMVKRVGGVIYNNVMAFKDGKWQAGTRRYGLDGGWIDLSRDRHNQSVYSPSTAFAINLIKQQIMTNNHQDIRRLSQCEQEFK